LITTVNLEKTEGIFKVVFLFTDRDTHFKNNDYKSKDFSLNKAIYYKKQYTEALQTC